MPEKCTDNPRDCPMLPRVQALENANHQHSETHREIFGRLNTLESSGAVQKETLRNIDEKLDDVKATVNSLAEKPGKRWDGLVDKLIYAAAGAVIAWLAAGMPGIR